MMTTNPFECPVCLEVYDSGDHIPTTFLCGHSCCISHASGLDGCPICRGPIPKKVSASVSLRDGAVAYMKVKADLEKKTLNGLKPPSKWNMGGDSETIDVPEAMKNSIESFLPILEVDYGVKLKIFHNPGKSSKLSIKGDDADIIAIAKNSIEEIIEREMSANKNLLLKPSSNGSTGISNEQKSGFSDPFKPFESDPFAAFSSSTPLVPAQSSNDPSAFVSPVLNVNRPIQQNQPNNFFMDILGINDSPFTSPTSQLSPFTIPPQTGNGSPFIHSNHSSSPFSPHQSSSAQASMKQALKQAPCLPPPPPVKHTLTGPVTPKEHVYIFIDQANALATARYLIDPRTNFIIGDPTRFIRFGVLDSLIVGNNKIIKDKVVFPYLDQSCLTKIEETISTSLTTSNTLIIVTATDPYSQTHQDAFFYDVILKAIYKGCMVELWTWRHYCHEKYSQLQQAYSGGLRECLTIHYLDDYSDILLSQNER